MKTQSPITLATIQLRSVDLMRRFRRCSVTSLACSMPTPVRKRVYPPMSASTNVPSAAIATNLPQKLQRSRSDYSFRFAGEERDAALVAAFIVGVLADDVTDVIVGVAGYNQMFDAGVVADH